VYLNAEGLEHKLYMDNFFSSPHLSDDLAQKKNPVLGEWG